MSNILSNSSIILNTAKKKDLYQNYLVPQAYEIQYVIHSKLALQTVEKTHMLIINKTLCNCYTV